MSGPFERPKPRAMLSGRIREEYNTGMDALLEEMAQDPRFRGVQKYHVLEFMLRDVLTPEGRERIRAAMLES